MIAAVATRPLGIPDVKNRARLRRRLRLHERRVDLCPGGPLLSANDFFGLLDDGGVCDRRIVVGAVGDRCHFGLSDCVRHGCGFVKEVSRAKSEVELRGEMKALT